MHNRSIDIAIVSNTAHMETILSQANLSDAVILSYKTVAQLTLMETNRVDILICDFFDGFLASLQEIHERTLIILRTNQQQLVSIPQSVMQRLEDIWLETFDATMMQFRLQKVVERVLLNRQHRINQICLDTVINNVPDLVWFKNLDGIHLKVNNEFCYTVGKTREEIEGYDHYHIWDIDKEEYEKSIYVCLDTDSIVIQSKTPGVFDEKVEGQRGMRQLKTYKSPIIDDQGELVGTVGVAQDVTELKNMNIKLDLILDSMPFAIMVKDLNECVLNINQKFADFFETDREAIIGKPYHIRESCKANASNPPNLLFYEPDTEIHLRHNNSDIILEVHKEPIYDFFENCVGKLCVYREVTVERNYEEQLKSLAYTDQLTGLFTRRYLCEFADENIDVVNTCLFYIDMDDFKRINDTYGHVFGDKVLRNIGAVLRGIFPDDICVRMGGDEFLVCCRGNFNAKELQEKANMLLTTIKAQFALFPATQQPSLSVGIATTDGSTPVRLEELLKKSDIALYRAKNSGKRQYVVYKPEFGNS